MQKFHVMQILAICTLCFGRLEAATSKKPNILFIMADDLGWNDVSWHNPQMPTPNLHNLATNYAAILNQSYVNQICTPTRSAFLTGYYPFHLGTQDGVFEGMEPGGVPLRFPFISEHFKRMGYNTYMVGKWHVGYCNRSYIPSGRGFDYFYGYYLSIADYFTHHYFYTMASGRKINALDFWDQLKPDFSKFGIYNTEIFGEKAVEIIQNQTSAQPFFMYLPFQAPHYPLQVPSKYRLACQHVQDLKRQSYCAMVFAMDMAIGRVVSTLLDTGLYENTIIVVNSDNGGEVRFGGNNFPLRGAKHTLWEGGNRAVSFVHSPKFILQPGVRQNSMFSIVDWVPTLLSAAGHNTPTFGDGLDQWDMITKNFVGKRSGFVYNINHSGAGIRVGKYKLITGTPGPHGLNGWYPPPNGQINMLLQKPFRGPWLFTCTVLKINNCVFCVQILQFCTGDPTEHVNLAKKLPRLLAKMTSLINRLKRDAAPSVYKPFDPRGDPKLHNNTMATGWC